MVASDARVTYRGAGGSSVNERLCACAWRLKGGKTRRQILRLGLLADHPGFIMFYIPTWTESITAFGIEEVGLELVPP